MSKIRKHNRSNKKLYRYWYLFQLLDHLKYKISNELQFEQLEKVAENKDSWNLTGLKEKIPLHRTESPNASHGRLFKPNDHQKMKNEEKELWISSTDL